MTAAASSTSTTLTPIQRHQAAIERRRKKLSADRARGASREVLQEHETAIARLSGFIEQARERAATEAEHAELEAKLARKEAAEDAATLTICGRVLDRIQARAQAQKAAAARATPLDRHRARQLRRSPPTARRLEVDEKPVLIDDPSEPGTEVFATLNRRVDILEYEKAHKRIGEQQYCLGRIVQAVFERCAGRVGSGGWNAGSRVDAVTANELRMIYAVDDARVVQAYMDRITRALGHIDMRILRQVLGERLTFAQVAEARGRAGRQGTAYYADRFRDALAALVEAWAAKGTAQRDEEGRPKISGERAAPTGEETDAAGVVVPRGHGQVWGVDQGRFVEEMNPDARMLSEASRPVRDRVAARRRFQSE